jgi:hypothetical protein
LVASVGPCKICWDTHVARFQKASQARQPPSISFKTFPRG